MTERIDNLQVDLETRMSNLFIDSPGDWLVQACVDELLKVPQWVKIFGDKIDAYMRRDYDIRNFPALRLYNTAYAREYESWWVEGDVVMDIILPASLRRVEIQRIPDIISSAMLQQFRRTPFFNAVRAKVPGLNELGKRFHVDKNLMYAFDDSEEQAPLTQVSVNFRIDLRQWDDYLEKTYRTIDDPYEKTLKNLERIAYTIEGLRDGCETEVIVEGITTTDGKTLEEIE